MKTHTRTLILLAMLGFGIASCLSETPIPSVTHAVSFVSPLNSPIAPPPSRVELPANVEMAGSWRGDLDGDGYPDLVLAVGNSERVIGQVHVYTSLDGTTYTLIQQLDLPEKGQFHQLIVSDVNLDGTHDIGVYEVRPKSDEYVLFVYVHSQDTYVLKRPKGGVLDGQAGFVSLAQPAIVSDVDGEGELEVVVFVEGATAGYLASRPYSWDGSDLSFADYLYLPGRKRP
jgi:hypothetical protein